MKLAASLCPAIFTIIFFTSVGIASPTTFTSATSIFAHRRRSVSSWYPGPERKVRLVCDALKTNPVKSEKLQKLVYPSHCWVMFEGTVREGPLRVELAAPIIKDTPRGLVISVTEYTNDQIDMGGLEDPHKPPDTVRTGLEFAMKTHLTNEQIFGPNAGVGPEDDHHPRTRNMVEEIWVANALVEDDVKHPQSDDQPLTASGGRFGTSHQFATDLLVSDMLNLDADPDLDALLQFAPLEEGEEWASNMRILKQGSSKADSDIGYVIWQAPLPGRSAAFPSQTLRRLFDLDKIEDLYVPRQVHSPWSGLTVESTRSRKQLREPYMSHNPWLTSSILSAVERGSLYEYCLGRSASDAESCALISDD